MAHLCLKKLEAFADLSDVDRQALNLHFPRVFKINAREDLFGDGMGADHVNVILEGWACRYKQLEDGRRQIVSFFLPGDLCDPLTFMFKGATHGLMSLSPVMLARLKFGELMRLMQNSPTLQNAIWRDVLVGAEIAREWTVGLGRRSARERMAHLFCEFAFRLKAVGLSNGSECEMPVTQNDLADALGLSTVHVSRTLTDLRTAGLVDLKGKWLTIHDKEALREVAMFDPEYLHLRRALS